MIEMPLSRVASAHTKHYPAVNVAEWLSERFHRKLSTRLSKSLSKHEYMFLRRAWRALKRNDRLTELR